MGCHSLLQGTLLYIYLLVLGSREWRNQAQQVFPITTHSETGKKKNSRGGSAPHFGGHRSSGWQPCPQGTHDPVRAQEGSAAGSAGTDTGRKTVWGWAGGWELERGSLRHQLAGRTAGALAPPPSLLTGSVWIRQPSPSETMASFSAASGLLPWGPHVLQAGCLRVLALCHISEALLEIPSHPPRPRPGRTGCPSPVSASGSDGPSVWAGRSPVPPGDSAGRQAALTQTGCPL